MKIIQLSDLHLTRAPDAELFGSSPLTRLERAIDSILAAHADADFCLLTGDLADAGSDAAYAALAATLARLPMPAHLLPGNHDDRAALHRQFPQLPADAGGFLQRTLATPAGRFLLLDTVEAGAPWGSYCAARQAWLAQQIAASGDAALWIAMHHPPLALGIPSMDQFALRDAEALWSLIAPHRARIRHLFFGHLHRPIGGSWRGIPFSCPSSPNHQVALDLATLRGDEVPGCREPAGYAVILVDDDSVVVHHQQLFNGETSFWL
ncbi:phosphodiesterase [Dechloromonas sp. H13]|uniref:phosphodiesterase n=1 Tax=Dechloromonas sp. H13 TaxID=2570193 RepID=UPI00129207D0|nr:phosphodiesterase [Dechloromonas sp. H13]